MLKKIALSFVTVLIPLQTLFAIAAFSEVVVDETSYDVDIEREFNVDIDVDAGAINILRSDDIKECRVRIEYTEFHFTPEITFNTAKNKLDICIDIENIFHKETCNDDSCEEHRGCGSNNNKEMKVVIELPYGPQTDIDAKIKAGNANFQLGDLAISDFRLKSLAGEMEVDFDQPNRSAMKNFKVHTMIGETKLNNLGNARIAYARINSGIGSLNVDFNGLAVDDLHARIDLDIGETKIVVPENLGVKAHVSRFMFFSNMQCPDDFNKRGKNYYSKNYDTASENITLDITQGIGELKLRTESCRISKF